MRGQSVAARHLGSLDAVADHYEQGLIVGGVAQTRLRQNRALASFALGPVATGALSLQHLLSGLQIGRRGQRVLFWNDILGIDLRHKRERRS